tara:strand:+ start:490 stop:1221 length:732 start_codon:yes stop_codon:yes gene_type:complete
MTKSNPQTQGSYSADEPETLDLFAQMSFETEPKKQTPNIDTNTKTNTIQEALKTNQADLETKPVSIDEEELDDIEEDDEIDFVEKPVKRGKIVREPKSSRRKGPRKSKTAFKTISEVATHLGVPQHVLRFWETKFSLISPMKRGGGRRYYRPEDVVVIERIHDLLYKQGYTIKGVQRLIKIQSKAEFLTPTDQAVDGVEEVKTESSSTAKVTTGGTPPSDDKDQIIEALLKGLQEMRQELTSD